MKRYIHSLFVPPFFDDESKNILASRLFNILHAIIFLSAAFSIPFALFPALLVSRFIVIAAIVLPLCFILLEATRRGWVQVASYSLIVFLWGVVTIGAATAGGVRAPIFMGYLVIIVISSLLLGGRAIIVASGLSISGGFGLAFAEANNLLPQPSVNYTPYSAFLIYAFFTLSVLVLQRMAWRTVRAALASLRNELKERKRVENNLQQRANEMYLLYQMGKALTSGENLYQSLGAMVQELKHLMTVDAFYVGTYDETSNTISFPLYVSQGSEVKIPPRNLTAQPGLTARVIQTGQTLHLPRVQSPEVRQNFEIVVIADPDINSYIGIPLINEGRILGVISVQAREPGAYSQEQVRMLETLASQVAITVEKLNLLEQIKRELEERKRAEAEVRKLNDELEKRVAERTAALEQANQEMQAFSYSISHDLRAPLRSIRSFSQILKNDFSGQLDHQGRNYLEKVTRAAEEMSELIDSLLTLFRFSRGELRRARLDLSAEAGSVLETLRHAEPGRAVTCQAAEGLFVHADESLMRNVLENLLGNAWKYSAQNPEARIEFGAETCNGETIYFVRDNGAGFDMQYAGKLFQPFQRLHRADEFPGHGIGLATVQRIIRRHGGRIWAQAAVGQGATFYFTLG